MLRRGEREGSKMKTIKEEEGSQSTKKGNERGRREADVKNNGIKMVETGVVNGKKEKYESKR